MIQQCHDLKRSHIIPKSILEIFRTGFVHHYGNKSLTVAGGTQSFKGQAYHSEKTIAKFMLCGKCEMLLSKEGEQDFMTNFFKKIYDPSDTKALMAEHKVL